MQPVPCWEQLWVPSEVNPSLKVYKWVKTEKIQVGLQSKLTNDKIEPDVLALQRRRGR